MLGVFSLDGGLGGFGFQTTPIAAGAGGAVWIYGGVAQIAGVAEGAVDQLSASTDGHADAGTVGDKEKILIFQPQTGGGGTAHEVGIVAQIDGDGEAAGEQVVEGFFIPVGNTGNGAGGIGVLIDRTGDADADPDDIFYSNVANGHGGLNFGKNAL